jgi:hypothetical protein
MNQFHLSLDRFFLIPELTHEVLLNELLDEVSQPFEEVDLLVSVWFESELEYLNNVIEIIKSKNFKSIKLILDYQQIQNYNIDLRLPVEFINFLAMITCKIHHSLPKLKKTGKGLVLTGTVSERLNRIGLLKSLYDQKFLTNDNLIWTFAKEEFNPQNIINKEKFDMYNDIESAVEYFDKHSLQITNTVTANMFSNPNDIDYLYQITDYSIIPESFFVETIPKVTEKTYRAILNQHPFIVVGSVGSLNYLKSFGFRTFEEYFTIDNYDSITDHLDRLSAVTSNILEFPSVLKKFEDQINKDVNYNYNLLKEIVDKDSKKLKKEYLLRGLPVDDIDEKFQINYTRNFSTLDERKSFQIEFYNLSQDISWIKNYNQIKGQDWPTITSKTEFYTLPLWVQQECIDVFNLHPDKIV